MSFSCASPLIRRPRHRECPEATLPGSTIGELLQKVTALISDVLGADDLDGEAKRTLVDRLRDVEVCLIDTRLRRLDDLNRTTDGLVGGFGRAFRRLGKRLTLMKVAAVLAILTSSLDAALKVQELSSGPTQPEQVRVVFEQITGASTPTAIPGPADYTIDEEDDVPGDGKLAPPSGLL